MGVRVDVEALTITIVHARRPDDPHALVRLEETQADAVACESH